jgi:hypothetical protein
MIGGKVELVITTPLSIRIQTVTDEETWLKASTAMMRTGGAAGQDDVATGVPEITPPADRVSPSGSWALVAARE